MPSKFQVSKVTVKYRITLGDFDVFAKIHDDGTMTIEPWNKMAETGFVFSHSDRETIKSIGRMLVKASKLE